MTVYDPVDYALHSSLTDRCAAALPHAPFTPSLEQSLFSDALSTPFHGLLYRSVSSLLPLSLPSSPLLSPTHTSSKYDQLAAIGVKGTANIKRFVGRDQASAPSAYVLDPSY